jgi:lipid kinase YegS
MKLWLVVNGKGGDEDGLRSAVAALREQGHEIAVRVTWEGGDAERIVAEASAAGAEVIVACGGDGTLHEVAASLHLQGSSAALGMLPRGTANDFATACGLGKRDAASALGFVTQQAPLKIDLGAINGHPFLNVVTAGFGAEITAQTPSELKDSVGGLAYLLTGISNLGALEARQATLRWEGGQWSGALGALAVGNGAMAGGGFVVCPGARLDDGLLEVSFVPAEGGALGWVRALARFVRDGQDEGVHTMQVSWLEVDAPDGLHISVDGEPQQLTSLRFDALPGAIHAFIPSRILTAHRAST